MNAGKVARYGLLTGVMLVLGYLESLLPVVGIPGIKLGLSNTVLLYALYLLDAKSAVLLAALKVLLSAFLFGSPAAMLYSAAGAALSLCGMMLFQRFRGVSVIGVSIVGAVGHNIGQCAVASLFGQVRAILAYFPLLLVSAAVTGVITGVTAKYLLRYIKKK